MKKSILPKKVEKEHSCEFDCEGCQAYGRSQMRYEAQRAIDEAVERACDLNIDKIVSKYIMQWQYEDKQSNGIGTLRRNELVQAISSHIRKCFEENGEV